MMRNSRDTRIQAITTTVGIVLVALVIGLLLIMGRFPVDALLRMLAGGLLGALGAAIFIWWRKRT